MWPPAVVLRCIFLLFPDVVPVSILKFPGYELIELVMINDILTGFINEHA